MKKSGDLILARSQSGQVVVEYTLLLVVVIGLVITVFGIIKERFLATGPCRPGQVNPVCFIQRIIDPTGDLTFKNFYIKK